MITLAQVKQIRYGTYLYSLVQRYPHRKAGQPWSPVRVRVTGKVKMMHNGWRLPVKYGLNTNMYVNPVNAELFTLSEEEAVRAVNKEGHIDPHVQR